MVGWTGAKRMPADAHVLPEQWRDFFERLEVMVFSGSAGHPRTADDDELRDVARQCVAQAHARLADDADLAAEVRAALAESPYMPWGTRLDVQGSRLPLGCERHEAPPRRSGGGPAPTGRAPQADTINEFLCLLRGPRAVGMGDCWIGIAPSPRPLRRAGGMASPQVRHDETPYITGRVGWLLCGTQPLLWDVPTKLEFSSSVKSKSIRLIFGRIDCAHRVLEAQRKCSCQNIRIRAH